jgi:FMN phosphatase YigB (HAD superfamily)
MKVPWRGVVVFDVDCTLTREHVSARINAARKQTGNKLSVEQCVAALPPNEKLVCDAVRHEQAMMDFLHFCRVNRIALAFASFGYHAYVDQLAHDMTHWLPALRKQWLKRDDGSLVVLTPRDFGAREGADGLRNKNRMLLHAATVAQVPSSCVLLVDDSVENVAASSVAGTHGYLVTNPNGMTRQDWQHICARLAHFLHV